MSVFKLPSGDDNRAQFYLAMGLSTVIAALGLWAQNSALVGVNYDDGIYALLSRSLSTGQGYRLTHLPISLPGIKYPPLYPLSLVPFWLLTSSQDAALLTMKLANGLYLGLAAGLFSLLLARLQILPLGLAAVVSLLGFAAGSTMLFSVGLLSEPLYLVLLFLALLAADSLPRSEPARRRLLAVGTLAGLVVLTRTAGLALLAAVILGLWRRRGPRPAALIVAVAGLVVMPWLLFVAAGSSAIPEVLEPRYGSYLQLYLANLSGSLGNALDIAATNVGAILQTLGAKVVPQLDPFSHSLLGGVVLVLAALGSRTIADRAPVTALYPWLYLALISVWSFPPFRFVFVIYPLLLALAVASIATMVWRLRPAGSGPILSLARQGPRLLIIAVTLAVGANMAYREGRSLTGRVWDGAALEKSAVAADIVDWVRAHTDSDAIVAHELEPLVALHSGRRAVPNNYEAVHTWYARGPAPVEPLRRLLFEMEVDYLVVRRDIVLAAEPINALMNRYPGSLRLVHIGQRGLFIFEANLAALGSEQAASGREPDPAHRASDRGSDRETP